MHSSSYRALIAVLGIGATACGSPPNPELPPPSPAPTPVATASARPAAGPTPDAEYRKQAPSPGPPVVFVPPRIEEAKLSNGMRLLLVERHELPIVAVQIVIDRGADQAPAGAGAFTGAMLLQGTKTRSALVLSDELEKLGASYGAWVDYDGGGVRGQCLTPKLGETLALLADVIQNPAFDKAEMERERSRRLTALAQQKDSPGTLLNNALVETLYPRESPYASPLLGNEAALKKMSTTDLGRFHTAQFQPDHATISFAGDITKDRAVAEAERALGKWKGKAPKASAPGEPPAPKASDPRVVLVDRPGATQSSVAVALPGVPRKSKDFDALTVMNTILGGQFSSRLNLNLREKHAYTYGARSGFEFRHGPGPFSAGAAIVTDKTEPAIREILAEIDRMRNDLVTEAELADAKSSLIQQLPSRFETAGETASTLAALAIFDLPLDEFATRPERYRRVTREDVKRVATTYLKPERLRVVVVGDAAVVKDGLGKLGLGAVTVRKPPDVSLEATPPPASAGGAKSKGQ